MFSALPRYKAKLRKVFHLYQASEGSVLRIVELRSRGSNVTRIMFRMEDVSFQFRDPIQ